MRGGPFVTENKAAANAEHTPRPTSNAPVEHA
jgi:hypothetical protein